MNGPVTFTAGASANSALSASIGDTIVVQHEPQSSAQAALTTVLTKCRTSSVVPIVLVAILGGDSSKVLAYNNTDGALTVDGSNWYSLHMDDPTAPSTVWDVKNAEGASLLRTLGEAPADTTFEGKLSAKLTNPWSGDIAQLVGVIESAATPLRSDVVVVINKHAGAAFLIPCADETDANGRVASLNAMFTEARRICTVEVERQASASASGKTALG
jgi:hypothetical protein